MQFFSQNFIRIYYQTRFPKETSANMAKNWPSNWPHTYKVGESNTPFQSQSCGFFLPNSYVLKINKAQLKMMRGTLNCNMLIDQRLFAVKHNSSSKTIYTCHLRSITKAYFFYGLSSRQCFSFTNGCMCIEPTQVLLHLILCARLVHIAELVQLEDA